MPEDNPKSFIYPGGRRDYQTAGAKPSVSVAGEGCHIIRDNVVTGGCGFGILLDGSHRMVVRDNVVLTPDAAPTEDE